VTADPLAEHVPAGPVPSSAEGVWLLDLVKVMAKLRGPGGCPWDAEQTHTSLAKHLLEESHEVLDAIDSGEPERLRDELGDLLLQVAFHAELAREVGDYDIDDVARGIVAKLVRRHPHVFGDVDVEDAGEVLVNWEKIKEVEKGAQGVEEDIPVTLPALARASKVQRRAAGFGFSWRSPEGAFTKLHEELAELESATSADDQSQVEAELGDVLFATVSVARQLGVDPEQALRRTTTRFATRYEQMRARATVEGVDLESLDEAALLAYFRAART